MRSAAEIHFRLRRELANILLYAFPPKPHLADAASPLPGLPDPARVAHALKGTPWAADLVGLAEQILAGHIPLLGAFIEAGPDPAWRRDYLSGKETAAIFFRRIPYLDADKVGDHKNIWELSRHQHLVLLAQVFVLTGDARYSRFVIAQLRHWMRENPFQCGINWASSLEVGFRTLSWIWIFHLMGGEMDAAFRKEFLIQLYRHGLHLEYNLSFYFSPNTHLLGEALALHALGFLFPGFSRSAHWREMARKILVEQLEIQVHPDGGYFEQSTYYHVYALDMYLFHHLLEPLPGTDRLAAMAEFLANMVGTDGQLPFLGDDDGGRLFHPFGPRDRFARATLATCSLVLGRAFFPYVDGDIAEQAVWWLGPRAMGRHAPAQLELDASRCFPQFGLVSMRSDDMHVLFDCGPFGPWGGGHSHSDSLSLVVTAGTEEVLIDPGTYTYVGDPVWREYFRGSAAHNTIRVNARDQAEPVGPFRWRNKPRVELLSWKSDPGVDRAEAACWYAGIRHSRTVTFEKVHGLLTITDMISAVSAPVEAGNCQVEQFWHPGERVTEQGPGCWSIGDRAELTTDARAEGVGQDGWRSDALASKREARVLVVTASGALPIELKTTLRVRKAP